MATPQDIQKEIVFTRKRITEADKELYNLIVLRASFYRHLLAETARYQDALIYEADLAQATTEAVVIR